MERNLDMIYARCRARSWLGLSLSEAKLDLREELVGFETFEALHGDAQRLLEVLDFVAERRILTHHIFALRHDGVSDGFLLSHKALQALKLDALAKTGSLSGFAVLRAAAHNALLFRLGAVRLHLLDSRVLLGSVALVRVGRLKCLKTCEHAGVQGVHGRGAVLKLNGDSVERVLGRRSLLVGEIGNLELEVEVEVKARPNGHLEIVQECIREAIIVDGACKGFGRSIIRAGDGVDE